MLPDKAFITEWSRRYLERLPRKLRDDEEDLLGRVGPQVGQRGFYRLEEVERVNKWKLPTERNRAHLAKNSTGEIEAVTREALAAPDHLQLHILVGWLYGVSDAVASALLMFPLPDKHTVIDFHAARALEGLQEKGHLPLLLPWRPQGAESDWVPPYPLYIDVCRRLAEHLDVSLRDLDRALWQWHKEA
jgi:hypothetical protein